MKTDTKSQILKFLLQNGPRGPSSIANSLEISPQMAHRHLKDLLATGDIRKQGAPPTVLYFATAKQIAYTFPEIDENERDYIERNYLAVKPDGEVLAGLKGLQWWAIKTKQHKNFKALAHEYAESHKKYALNNRNEFGLINATFKVQDTFDQCFLDYLFYQEFYSLPKFGKTKTGQLVFLGKSGQDLNSIKKLAKLSKPSIQNIIKKYKIDCITFAPHSIPRKISFLKVFKENLSIHLPVLKLKKVFVNNIPVAQKSLSKLDDRIENARNTIFTDGNNNSFKRILVIDDAVGSGATLNIIAEKLKIELNAEFVCGFAVTGSLKGFEVINEI